MPRFEVLRDTIDSNTGRIYRAGEIMEMAELPQVVERDVEGRPVLGADGKPKTSPMKIGGNLKPIDDQPKGRPSEESRGRHLMDETMDEPDEPKAGVFKKGK